MFIGSGGDTAPTNHYHYEITFIEISVEDVILLGDVYHVCLCLLVYDTTREL